MSLLAIGLSHRTARVDVLERAAVGADDLVKLLHELVGCDHIGEAMCLSTCNRVEVYTDTDKFHGGVDEVSAVLARHAGIPADDLTPHLYVHYEQAAVHHLFRVAAGLDSMVVGESQILGQLRQAYRAACQAQTAGRELHELAQRALAAGKRVHTETSIDAAGASVVSRAVARARHARGGLAGTTAVIVGAGSTGGLVGSSLRLAGVADVVVANRSAAGGERLARSLHGRAVALDALPTELAAADVLVTCTGSTSVLLDVATLTAALDGRGDRSLVVLDLGLPRDVDPATAALPGVTYIDLDALTETSADEADTSSVAVAEQIVAVDVEHYLSWQRTIEVAPTVSALRARAADVVGRELARLDARLPGLDPRVRAECERTVRRTVSTLLHGPTVRVKELAHSPEGDLYADALRTLFGLLPGAADVVSAPSTAELPKVTEPDAAMQPLERLPGGSDR